MSSGTETQSKPPISTHILDTSRGVAAANVPVTLYSLNSSTNNWMEIRTSCTNTDGRCTDFLQANQLQAGCYKLKFNTNEYFQRTTSDFLYPFIEIVFNCQPGQHYHIPLLLQPFGYSTYRGT